MQRPFDPTNTRSEKIWQNTLAARAFDIARGLLPIGTTTLLSWTTPCCQARDNLRRLKHHPLPEVREVCADIFAELSKKYPHSFKGDEMQDEALTPRDTYSGRLCRARSFPDADDAIRHLTDAGRGKQLSRRARSSRAAMQSTSRASRNLKAKR